MTPDVIEILGLLESSNGPPPPRERLEAVDELVACILSQHTTDATSFPTFDLLKATWPNWGQVVAAGQAQVADLIRPAGLANQKSKSILACLQVIKARVGDYSLEMLAGMPAREARDWLTSLPGVGPKTASIVLCFSFGMDIVPVDTHVHRVAKRVGFIPEKMDANRAHDALLDLVPAGQAYRFHMDLIVHGRRTCRAQRPSCDMCVIRTACRFVAQA